MVSLVNGQWSIVNGKAGLGLVIDAFDRAESRVRSEIRWPAYAACPNLRGLNEAPNSARVWELVRNAKFQRRRARMAQLFHSLLTIHHWPSQSYGQSVLT